MAHFAELDQNNTVLRVVVVDDQYESDGENWCQNFFGGGNWKQTSYNATIRKNFAGIGYTYDSIRDAYIPPQPYPSWLLDEDTCQWNAPVAMPDDGQKYQWSEETTSWEVMA